MTVLEKPFLPIDGQIEKLVRRGLVIESSESAKRQLLKTSYYDLINGYKDMFLETKSDPQEEDKFLAGTMFEDLTKLFEVDRVIRHVSIQISLDVECNFYSTLAYCISEEYGEKEADYLKKDNYKSGKWQSYNRKTERENLLRKINNKIESPIEQPLKYYKETYGNIPPWILVKDLTFGELIVLYKLSSTKIKENVIKIIVGVEPTEENKEFFLKSMEIFNKFRNRAAHGGRMYNFKTNIELPYKEQVFSIWGITKDKHNKGLGKSDFAAFTIALLHLFQNDYRGLFEFMITLHHSFKRYQEKQPLHFEGVLKELGLPMDYYERFFQNT